MNCSNTENKYLRPDIVQKTTLAVLLFLLSASIAFAQQEPGQATAGTGTIMPTDKTSNETTPVYIIIQSENYIKSFVDNDYFNKRFKLAGNKSLLSGTGEIFYYVYYSYNIPSDYLASPNPKYVSVSLDKDGKIIDYVGPKKPHEFSISRDHAAQIAKQRGLKEPIIAEIDRVMASNSIDGYTWVVTGPVDETSCRAIGGTQECLIPGIYVDVDNGSVTGAFNRSNLIQESASNPEVNQRKEAVARDSTQSPIAANIVFITGIIALLILIFIIWYKFYK